MPGTIAYCSREDHAPPAFAGCLARLCQRHPDAKVLHMIGNDIADLRNQAVVQSEGDWIWFIDTDMVFAPETLERLLAHEVDLVQVLCLMRHPPHAPVLWETTATTKAEKPHGYPRLVEVQSLGAGGTLYRRRIFEAMPGPWFEGVIGTEDTCLAQKAKAHGFTLYVDLATPVGHVTPMAVWPVYNQGEWHIRYDWVGGKAVNLPFLTNSPIVQPDLIGVR